MKHLNFNKEFKNYDANATIQKKVADKLLTFIDKNTFYESVLELGCGTGIFTKTFFNVLNFNALDLNDIFNTKEYFNTISYRDFFIDDMSKMHFDKYSLIVSSSAFQWVENLEELIRKLSFSSDNLVFSIYTKGNLIEILNHFSISLNYLTTTDIYNLLKKYYTNVKYIDETFSLEFSSPLEALKHLKKTGVTGFQKSSYSLTKSFNYKNLTYKVSYFSCEK
ncbi:methyltransferase domain-containing protein [uncultured Cetobacterium sp.]|uniref:methyltransferase domain-containing protein n=1 Tax=uncultured Cetobacterium sp. TaxID=527638 RepID=UPI00261D450C|nr:methyltransferase domain-containing protein [uncultured Cetobacterium sp.]